MAKTSQDSKSSHPNQPLRTSNFDLALISGYLKSNLSTENVQTKLARVVVSDKKAIQQGVADFGADLAPWQREAFADKDHVSFQTSKGPIYLTSLPSTPENISRRNNGLLVPSDYGRARDHLGAIFAKLFKADSVAAADLSFVGQSEATIVGALVGIELAAYSYKRIMNGEAPKLQLQLGGIKKSLVDRASAIARGTNLARHLVNLPPNYLYPQSYAELVESLFDQYPEVSIEIWDEQRLQAENMNLHLAVGRAADYQPRLVKVSFRPAPVTADNLLTVLVGKGITFDSGGLDLKPAPNMRLMKKDMGGSAAVVGSFYALLELGYKKPVDLYLPLAENAISGSAFRPSDVIAGRNGKTVEIHNTDAEGRLVLADSLTLAKENAAKEPTRAILNVATLTGAIKVGLGVGMGGFMTNDPELGNKISNASRESTDFMWEVPFYAGYRSQLKSEFADLNHCGNTPFGGAMTAGLYLLDYVDPESFAHFDIYSWNDSPNGAIREVGGSGQAVQCLVHLLESL